MFLKRQSNRTIIGSLLDNCVRCTTLNNFKSHTRLHSDWKPDGTAWDRDLYLREWTLYGVSLCLLMPSAWFTLVASVKSVKIRRYESSLVRRCLVSSQEDVMQRSRKVAASYSWEWRHLFLEWVVNKRNPLPQHISINCFSIDYRNKLGL